MGHGICSFLEVAGKAYAPVFAVALEACPLFFPAVTTATCLAAVAVAGSARLCAVGDPKIRRAIWEGGEREVSSNIADLFGCKFVLGNLILG